ncbi:MAG: hypothetical protein ACRELW_14885 [Candidatus Rokuibacteriota bacterium]
MSEIRERRFQPSLGLLVVGLLVAVPAAAPAAALILDGPTVLQQSPTAIQASLGRPVRAKTVPPGDFLLPEGGVWRSYGGHGMRIDVDFERDRSTTVVIDFPDDAIAPRTFEAALEAINLPSCPRPDLVMRDSREWHNLHGYYVRVVASRDRIDSIILSVHPFP